VQPRRISLNDDVKRERAIATLTDCANAAGNLSGEITRVSGTAAGEDDCVSKLRRHVA
jgi:hypothetical protein